MRGVLTLATRLATAVVLLAAPRAVAQVVAPTASTHDGDGTLGRGGAERRTELEDFERQDVARDLRNRGVAVRWQEHPLAELLDWRDRVAAAQALALDFGVAVDWRLESAPRLTDMRLRAAKAAQLRLTFGILIDWRRYSWTQLENLRLALAAMPLAPGRVAVAARNTPAVATRGQTGFRDPDALAPMDPTYRPWRRAPRWRDRDAILEPTFASAESRRTAGRPGWLHPDGILEPTFARTLPRPSRHAPDDLATPDFGP